MYYIELVESSESTVNKPNKQFLTNERQLLELHTGTFVATDPDPN